MAALTVKQVLKELKEKTTLVLESKANANLIVDLLEFSDSDKEKVLVAFIRAVHEIFTTLTKRGELFVKTSVKKFDDDQLEQENDSQSKRNDDPQDVFAQWLYEKYLLCVRKLLDLTHHGRTEVREFSVCTLMKFVVCEGARKQTKSGFPNNLYMKIVEALTESKHDMKELISRFAEYLEYDDIKYFTLKNIAKIIEIEKKKCEGKFGPFFVGNVFALLSKVKIAKEEEELDNFLFMQKKLVGDRRRTGQVFSLKAHRKVFSSSWLGFLQCELPSDIHKKVLVNLHCEVIPHLTDPKLLIDFLSDSYNVGGVTSLLALNGLFILTHQHNLDYPEFYKKLYALFEPGIFHVKYKERFFHLADLFLTSSYLPAYLVAAFAKRLARMALSAPPSGVMIAVPFVCNLLRRHPSCQVLIHRKQAVTLFLADEVEHIGHETHTAAGDPYNADETNPAKSNALNSCLWELKTLQSHYYHRISVLIEALEKPLEKDKESDISEYFDVNYQSLFEEECSKVTSETAFLEFQPPNGILGKEFLDFWTL